MLDVYLNEIRRLRPERGLFGRRTKRQENFLRLIRIYAEKALELYKTVEAAVGNENVFNKIRDMPALRYLDSHRPLSDDDAIEFHELVSGLEEGGLPFRTYEVEEKISNIVRVKDLLDGSSKEVRDINMDRGGIYLWLEGNGYLELKSFDAEKETVVLSGAAADKKSVPMTAKGRKGPASEEITPDRFYESDMTDPPYDAEECVGQDEDGRDIIRGFFEKSETIERLGILEAKMAPLIRWYDEIVSKEKKAGEGKLAGVRNLQEFAASMKFLDRNFYYVNVGDYRHIYFATDFHGSEQAFRKVLKATDFFGANRENDLWIFLGDYVDRGGHDYWILYHLLKMKQIAPDNVIILKGNHEYYPVQNGSVECQHLPNDFYEFMFAERRDSKKGPVFSPETLDLFFKGFFPHMASGVFLKGEKTYFAAHSGFIHQTVEIDFKKLWENGSDYFRLGIDRFPETTALEDLNSEKNLRDLIWVLPVREPYKDSLGKEVCLYSQANFMDKFKIDKVIRGHEHPLKGLECVNGKTKHELEEPGLPPGVMDEARVLTLFSAGHNDDLDHYRTYRSVVLRMDDKEKIAPMMIDGETA